MNASVFPLPCAPATNADPVFATIEEHREAWHSAKGEDWENGEEGKRLQSAWNRREEAAYTKLKKATPTTIAGLSALFDYIAENQQNSMDEYRAFELSTTTVRRALKRLANPPKAKTDAKLLKLGDEARAALRAYVVAVKAFNRAEEASALEPEMTKAGKDIAALLRRIGKQKAHTLAGVRLKLEAEVVARTYPDEWDQVVLQGDEWQGLIGIIDDLEGILLASRQSGGNTAVKLNAAGLSPEFVKLNAEFDRYDAMMRESKSIWNPLQEEHRKRYNAWRKNNPASDNYTIGAVYSAIYNDLEKEAKPRLPHPDYVISSPWVDRMMRKILATPAVTLGDFAIKARLAKDAAGGPLGIWADSDKDADWGDLCIRKLIESVLTTAGVTDAN